MVCSCKLRQALRYGRSPSRSNWSKTANVLRTQLRRKSARMLWVDILPSEVFAAVLATTGRSINSSHGRDSFPDAGKVPFPHGCPCSSYLCD